MRWIVLVLVFANVGYFAWGMFQQSQTNYRVVSGQSNAIVEPGRRLMLLSESDTIPRSSERLVVKTMVSPEKDSPDNGSPENGSDRQCLALGPFSSPDLVDQVQQRLFSLGIDSRERSDKNGQAADYWVHIPPLPGRDLAIRMLRELQAQKFDSFVITQGELSNGISLGLFSKLDSAKKVKRRLMTAGYTVEIKTLSRMPESWWLELDARSEDKLDDYFWGELVNRAPDIKKAKKSCKGIATGSEFL